jgi:hypothetical protein
MTKRPEESKKSPLTDGSGCFGGLVLDKGGTP